MFNELKLLTHTHTHTQKLGTDLSKLTTSRFSDGEIRVKLDESVRGENAYVIQPICRYDDGSVNDALMELLLIVSTLRRSSVSRVTAVIPYYGYARQDRTLGERVPISAAEVARLLTTVGVSHVIVVDLHCGQIQGFFPAQVPCDNVAGASQGAKYFAEKLTLRNPVIVSPDAGGVKRAKEFCEILKRMTSKQQQKIKLAMIAKQRSEPGVVSSMNLIGQVKNSDCIICDDMIDTGGTLCKAARLLKDRGARNVYAFASHGVFSGPAYERIRDSVLKEVVVLDTIPLSKGQVPSQIHPISVSSLLAEAIRRSSQNKSVLSLSETVTMSKL